MAFGGAGEGGLGEEDEEEAGGDAAPDVDADEDADVDTDVDGGDPNAEDSTSMVLLLEELCICGYLRHCKVC